MHLKATIKKKCPLFVLDVSIEVSEKDYVILLGPSGAGKSTILKIIAGVEKAEYQKIELNGKEITHLPPEKRRIVYLPQTNSLFPHLSVKENLIFSFKARKKSINYELLNRVIDNFDIKHLLDRYPNSLSEGEAQRVALARAICAEPEILLLDEPLSSLDFHLKIELIKFLKNFPQNYKISIIHVTHDLLEALLLANNVYILTHGKITYSGNINNFFKNLNNLNNFTSKKDPVLSSFENLNNLNFLQIIANFTQMMEKNKV